MSLVSDILYGSVALLTSPVWAYKLMRTGKWRTDWRGKFGHTAALTHDKPRLLIHAVSVGEVNTAKQLVDELERRHGEGLSIVISVTTDTGTAQAKKLFEPRHTVVRYPLDFTGAVRRFLDAVKPDVVALIELEVWPTFVGECTRRDVPVVVLNGRLSARSYKRYRWIKPLVQRSFAELRAAAVQDEAYAERFIGLGARPEAVSVTGTMKWDAIAIGTPDSKLMEGAETLARALGIDRAAPLIVCGSTGPGEEKLFHEQLHTLARGGKPVQLLMAPRKPERIDEVMSALPGAVRRTESPDGSARAVGASRVFVLDTIGEMKKAYALADVAVVGRSFCGLYGSNMIEPIALGKATVVGPETSDFQDQMDKLLAGGGIVQVADAAGLRSAVERLLDPVEAGRLAERGMNVVRQQQGATGRHADIVEGMLRRGSRRAAGDGGG
jgi:3-deoxy-D-manno-octulosonic-acid transferase